MTYRIVFTPRAEREFDTLDGPVRARIARSLAGLTGAPREATNVKALTGGGYRLRVGDWRVIFVLEDDRMVVLVLRVGHRRAIYR